MMDSIALYFRYVGISMRAQLQYRAMLLMQTIGHLLITVIEFLGLWALFHRFGALQGWSLGEVAFFYGLADVTFSLADAFTRGFDDVGPMVRRGEFDRVLLRPRSTVLQLLGQDLGLKRAGRLVQGILVMLWAAQQAGVGFTPSTTLLLLWAIAGGIALFFGIIVLQATSTFWTTDTLEVWSALTNGGAYMAQYPLAIYRPWFRRFFTLVVPVACVVYLPGVAVLGRPDPLGAPFLLQAIAPAAGFLFLGVSFGFWRLGIRRYTGTGS
jgi:ABC-2 type transport system permease protein